MAFGFDLGGRQFGHVGRPNGQCQPTHWQELFLGHVFAVLCGLLQHDHSRQTLGGRWRVFLGRHDVGSARNRHIDRGDLVPANRIQPTLEKALALSNEVIDSLKDSAL